MGKYSVVFFQDVPAASSLQTIIPWDDLGYTVIGSVYSIEAAITMITSAVPDVVLTDVRAPESSGLEVVRRGKAASPATEFVILTDCDDFECARCAMSLGVACYLTKPASAAALTAAFTTLRQQLNQRHNTEQNWRAMQQYYRDSLPLMQADFYAALIDGRVTAQALKPFMNDYQIALPGPRYACLVLHISSTQVPVDVAPLALRSRVFKQAKSFFEALRPAAALLYLGNTVLIVQLENEEQAIALTDDADRFCKQLKAQLGAVVTIGVGQVVSSLLALPLAYRGARMAVAYRSLYGASKSINIQEVAPSEIRGFTPISDANLSELFKCIHVGPDKAIAAAVDRYLQNTSQTAASLANHTVAVSDLISALYRFTVNNHLQMPALTDRLKTLYQRLPELAPESLRHWLLGMCIALNQELVKARDTSSTLLIENAKEFVRVHYSDEQLCLDDVCKTLCVSNSYFSTLFKRENGQAFITYLTNFRMNRASRLLLETTEKSQTIGHMVGYADPNYFSFVFKKHFGSSPTQYRSGLAAAVH